VRPTFVAGLMMVTLAGAACGVLLAASAQAEGCTNEQLRARQVYALRLPDCRAYEQVSPVDKSGTDALGEPGIVQSSPSGGGVTFFSVLPFPGVAGASGLETYLSTRAGSGWSTQGLLPRSDPGSRAFVTGLTEDLSQAVVNVALNTNEEPTPGPQNAYLRDSATGSFTLLGEGVASFADATPDGSRILFEDTAQLLPEATPGVVNLYESNRDKPPDEQLSLVGLGEDGKAPAGGSVAGTGAESEHYTQHTISEDGSRVFFTDVETGKLYLREPETSKTTGVSPGPAVWRAATPNGRYVLYTEGEELFRFDVSEKTSEAVAGGAAGVLGTLGVSDDGSYVYFVAESILASTKNANEEEAEIGAANLYEWHEGSTIFVAKLLYEEGDVSDWRDYLEPGEGGGPGGGGKGSRVAPDGKAVLFTSTAPLTGYDNTPASGLCDGEAPRPCFELFLYTAAGSGRLSCVSCNPFGAPAANDTYLTHGESIALPRQRPFLTRNLSARGDRVFFQTREALVPQDTNGQADVYGWEREGSGSCARSSESYSDSLGGCLYVISSGRSTSSSYFGDASVDGSDVFIFTRQSLVSQDQDDNADVYDARIEGGITAQNPAPQPAACSGEACRGAPGLPPSFGGSAGSASFPAGQNIVESPMTPKSKPTPRPATRAQKLAKALKMCRRKPKRKRRACKSQAMNRYGNKGGTSNGKSFRRRHS
jgi:hypothetical protein